MEIKKSKRLDELENSPSWFQQENKTTLRIEQTEYCVSERVDLVATVKVVEFSIRDKDTRAIIYSSGRMSEIEWGYFRRFINTI